MKANRFIAAVGMFLVAAVFMAPLPNHARGVPPDEARQIAKEAYNYGYIGTAKIYKCIGNNANNSIW